jgi:DNA-binding beta-propeller fold protein YncE
MAARKTITVIPISANTQRISISNDDRMVFTADQTKPQLAVIDTSANKLKAWVPLPVSGYGTASTKDGHWLLVALPSTGKVAVVDLAGLKVARTIDVPKGPAEILVRPDGQAAYVSCPPSNQVAVIDLSVKDPAGWKVQAVIDAGKYADGLAWAGLTPR